MIGKILIGAAGVVVALGLAAPAGASPGAATSRRPGLSRRRTRGGHHRSRSGDAGRRLQRVQETVDSAHGR